MENGTLSTEVNDAQNEPKGKEQKQLSKNHVLARLCGFAMKILEKRDPNFDAEKIKGNPPGLLVILASSFASKEECDVMMKLVGMLNDKQDYEDILGQYRGALEGASVVIKGLDPKLLLKDEYIDF